MKRQYVRIIVIIILFSLFHSLFYSCTPNDSFKQYHLKVISDVPAILSTQKTRLTKLFSGLIAATEGTGEELEIVMGKWEVLYRYLECLHAEIRAHKMHLYANNKTSNLITAINTASGDMLNVALVNATEVEVYARLPDRSKLRKILEEIENNTLTRLDIVLESFQMYHDHISDKN
ncbi:MAG: hypothetical protein JW881_20550 [Spirochaetales bacterium]|nr:hypothetical protein [Spirochaetales bacterium]